MPKKRLLKSKPRKSSNPPHRKTKPPIIEQPKARKRALEVLRRMRRTGISLTAAAHEEHVDSRTVQKYFGEQLRHQAKGTPYRATKADRLHREMLVPTAKGISPVTVRGSRQASLLGKYLSAVGEFLRTGRTKKLRQFKGKRIGGQPLIIAPETLRTIAQAGALQLDDIYAAPEVSA
jgi:hypothetical protein